MRRAILSVAAHFHIWNVDKWLSEISWVQLQEWIEFKDDYGEDRNDLRMGAVASLLVNLNVDTRKMGGSTRPNKYISTWDNDRKYYLVYQGDEKDKDGSNVSTTPAKMTKESWENFKTSFIKILGKEKKEVTQ